MQRDSIQDFFQSSATLKLLRSDLAPSIIEFLNETFKSASTISIGHDELRSQLESFQTDLHRSQPKNLIGSAESYLSQWVEKGWLARFLQGSTTEPRYQLTSHAEEAIRFVDVSLNKHRALVGTEGRLKLIMDSLQDLVRGSSNDPKKRLDFLHKQRLEIEAQIHEIEETDAVEAYQPTQVRERFQTTVDMLKALQADFRAVEEKFQKITREVQQRHTSGHESRGGILAQALDAEDHLKQEDEGISFFAFVNFLLSPNQQAALRATIEEIQKLDALANQEEDLQHVSAMVPALLAEADQVMKTAARLSATLRRLLEARASEHRIRVGSVLQDVKQSLLRLATGASDSDSLNHGMLAIDAPADIANPFARSFWKPQETLEETGPQPHVVDLSKVSQMTLALSAMRRLDLRELRAAIQTATSQNQSARLSEILRFKPLENGVAELLGYLQIAYDDGHQIDASMTESIALPNDTLLVRLPQIVFHPASMQTPGARKPK